MLCSAKSQVFQRTPPERPPNAPRTPPRTPPKRLPKASQREAPFESKLRKTNDPSLSNTWPPQKGYITQRHSTVSEFCSRQKELRENSSSARSCVRELRENSSSAGAVFSSAPQTATPPNAFRKLFKKEALLHIKLRTNQRSKPLKHLALKGYTIQSHSTVNEFCSRLGELRENSSSARSCNAPLPYSKVMCFLNALLSERPPKTSPERPPPNAFRKLLKEKLFLRVNYRKPTTQASQTPGPLKKATLCKDIPQ